MTSYMPTIRTTGRSSARTCEETPTYRTVTPHFNRTPYLVLMHGTGGTTTVKAIKLALKNQKPPYVTWHISLYFQAMQTPADPTVQPTLTYHFPGCWDPIKPQNWPPNPNWPSLFGRSNVPPSSNKVKHTKRIINCVPTNHCLLLSTSTRRICHDILPY